MHTVDQWTVWNLDSLFNSASVGANTTMAARVERLLRLCKPGSLAATQLVAVYREEEPRLTAAKKAQQEGSMAAERVAMC